jgi:hypothetical protein
MECMLSGFLSPAILFNLLFRRTRFSNFLCRRLLFAGRALPVVQVKGALTPGIHRQFTRNPRQRHLHCKRTSAT